ncbi:hypothetical protein MKX01_033777 [Papaver californicum]|nr:hypothetical protein MKX01_033777 [Papaver californicum]
MGLSKKSYLSFSLVVLFPTIFVVLKLVSAANSPPALKFKNGEFKILQVADMHYADGITTPCEDVLEMKGCSDLNTTAFDATDAAKSLDAAFAPAVAAGIPWAAVLGNHDMESTLTREELMKHIDAAYCIAVEPFRGAEGSSLQNKTVLNLYFLDSGDYSTVPSIGGYGWIKASQQFWYQKTSLRQQKAYMSKPRPQKAPAPGLAYFHIPLPEYEDLGPNFTGVKGEGLISSPSVNSGFFATLLDAGDVKAVFTGHDHLNDFCGELTGIHLCYSGGFGYHAYGLKGWPRRARVVSATLEKTKTGKWGAVSSIRTWKRLDDENLTTIDPQVLFTGTDSSILLHSQ